MTTNLNNLPVELLSHINSFRPVKIYYPLTVRIATDLDHEVSACLSIKKTDEGDFIIKEKGENPEDIVDAELFKLYIYDYLRSVLLDDQVTKKVEVSIGNLKYDYLIFDHDTEYIIEHLEEIFAAIYLKLPFIGKIWRLG